MTFKNYLKILNKGEKEELETKLKKQFGIEKIPGMIIKMGADRFFLFQGSLTKKQIQELETALPIERVGDYFAKVDERTKDIRLSIEGTHILKEQITKNIFELNEKQTEEWMMGRELNIQTGKRDFLIMKYKDDFLGTGKASELKISNFIPKNRRLKERS